MIFLSLITTNMHRKNKQFTTPLLKVKVPLVAQGSPALPNLQNAIALHQQGQIGQAEAIYLQLLQIDSRNADVLNLLGVIAIQTGQYIGAVEMIDKAIEINPNAAIY